MLEQETLAFRSAVLQKIRSYLTERSYIELDTPAMSPALIPDTAHEVFKAVYVDPWTDDEKSVFLGASHEYFLKKAVCALKRPLFQLSKSYSNCVSAGRLSSPEFTQLEVYTPETACNDSATLTENLIAFLTASCAASAAAEPEVSAMPFIRLSTEDAFIQYAGFSLSEYRTPEALAQKIRELGIPEFPDNPFDEWALDELYELLMSQIIESALPKDRGVFLMDCPSYVPCLAKEKHDSGRKDSFWKEYWTLYVAGTKLAISRKEENDSRKVRKFIESEGKIQNAVARVKPAIDADFWKTFDEFPECTGIELNVDRLIMLLARKNSIESVIPFPFRLKTGYY